MSPFQKWAFPVVFRKGRTVQSGCFDLGGQVVYVLKFLLYFFPVSNRLQPHVRSLNMVP